MISIKQAVQTAMAFITDMYGQKSIYNPLLDEIVFDAEDNCWRVTVSFDTVIAAADFTADRYERNWKVVGVSMADGEVSYMRNTHE